MVSHPDDPTGRTGPGQASAERGGERVARALARAGVASRREAERLVEAGRVALNGKVLTSPAVNVGPDDVLTLDGKAVAEQAPARLWRYHKPAGLLTTHKDPKGRPTVFERLPPGLPRVISVGRLDLSSEGLLLLTNDGALARQMELPSSGLVRRYRVRAFGRATQEKLDRLKGGITVDGVAYGPIEAKLERGRGSNIWIGVAIAEGKNREVRRVLEAVGLKVNRLIRVGYGPFELGALEPGDVDEVPTRKVRALLKGELGQDVQLPELGPAREPAPPTPPRPRRRAPGKAAAPPEKPTVTYKPGWARPKRKPPRTAPGPARRGRKD